MKIYSIRSTEEAPALLELLKEKDNGYIVRIVKHKEDWDDVSEEFMSHDLFETCIRTGYICELSA